MLLQTAAIEAFRQKPLAIFAALQPGTVQPVKFRVWASPSFRHPIADHTSIGPQDR
jgi:hypothetical protein